MASLPVVGWWMLDAGCSMLGVKRYDEFLASIEHLASSIIV
jgi:hypothetical protein